MLSDCLAPPAVQVVAGEACFSPAALGFLRRDLHNGEGGGREEKGKEAHDDTHGH